MRDVSQLSPLAFGIDAGSEWGTGVGDSLPLVARTLPCYTPRGSRAAEYIC